MVGGAMGVARRRAGHAVAGPRLRYLDAHHAGVCRSVDRRLEHGRRGLRLVSGVARGEAGPGGGAACGVNREYQPHAKTCRWRSHAVWTHQLPLAAHHPRHRHRHHYGGDRGVAAHRPAPGRGGLLPGAWARTTSSSTARPATPARTRRIPRNATPAPLKPEYADYIKRWCSSVADTGLDPLHSGGGRWQSADRARARLRIRHRSTSTASRPTCTTISPRDFDAGRYFTPEEDQRARARRDDRPQRGRFALPRWPRGGSHVHDGWRGVHRDRRLLPRPRADSSAKTARTTKSIFRCTPPNRAIRRSTAS